MPNALGCFSVSYTATIYPTTYENYEVLSGNASDTITEISFTGGPAKRVDITIWDNPAVVELSQDGTTYGNDIELPANTFMSIEVVCQSLQIKNKTSGETARYQVMGWW